MAELGNTWDMPPFVRPLTLALSFLLLFITIAITPLANAPPSPLDDRATVSGRVYCDACQNGRYDFGTDYPRSNTEEHTAEGVFNFTRLAGTEESAARQGAHFEDCLLQVNRVAAHCFAPVVLASATCKNPRDNLGVLHAGTKYNADVCFAAVPTPKKCDKDHSHRCARSLVIDFSSKNASNGRTTYAIQSMSLSNARVTDLYSHLTRAVPANDYTLTSGVQVMNDSLYWTEGSYTYSTDPASETERVFTIPATDTSGGAQPASQIFNTPVDPASSIESIVTNANWRASPSLLYKGDPPPEIGAIISHTIHALSIDDSVVPNIVYWVEFIPYYTGAGKPDEYTLKAIPLCNCDRVLLLGLQVDSVHGPLYVGYLSVHGNSNQDEFIMAVHNTGRDGLEAILIKQLGTIFCNFRINKYADSPVMYSSTLPFSPSVYTLVGSTKAIYKLQLDLSNNTSPVLAKGYAVHTSRIPDNVHNSDILYGANCLKH
eukprot:jgi/Chlat1/586/Chrsp103S01022